MTTQYHMCVSIEGVLRWKDTDLVGLFTNADGTKPQANELRDFLKLEMARGRKVLPLGEPCEGFDYENGCPGHPEQSRQ